MMKYLNTGTNFLQNVARKLAETHPNKASAIQKRVDIILPVQREEKKLFLPLKRAAGVLKKALQIIHKFNVELDRPASKSNDSSKRWNSIPHGTYA
ncbi:MAG: hypothetical protein U9Q15_05075 [Patescibacteria group bacterium]|nr:hypothetical protein [Patescibacteria group bacterium]